MAPGFEALSDYDFDDEEELDFSDLREQFAVKMDEGLDAFVVVDGLPIVSVEQKPKLVKFLLKKLNTVGKTTEDAIFMPMDDNNQSEGFAFVEYGSPEQALAATKHLHGTALDKKHTLAVNKVTDIEKYGREGKIDDEYTPPDLAPFQEKPHLKAWLGDPDARDQFLVFHGDNVSLYWNEKQNDPQQVFDRKHWTQLFTQWSPLGTYAATMHQQGVQLWGGPDFLKQRQFAHPFVSLIEFSPGENYLTTWSNQPIVVDESDKGPLSIEEDGKNILIWDITTGKVLRSFVSYDLPAQPGPDGIIPPKGKVQWPAFKWSADEKFVARMKPKESLSIYELPRMNLLDRTSIKIDGIVDFEWSPATPQRAGVKAYEQLLCYWTPEILSNPAKVCLMSVPSKEIVRALPLYNVTDAKLHWQSAGAYCCVKVDRQKSKKSLATNLEIFRIREKNIPCEVVDNLKDTVINFAWEPKGDRFVLITAGEAVPGSNVAPKTAVSFFCPEKVKGAVGNFKLIRTIEKKNNNGIYWSPKGRFVVVGTIAVAQFSDLDFWDLDYEGDKPESEANLSANLMLMNTVEHYGVTDVEWDPTGRYVTTSVSVWTNPVENGYRIWTFSGQMLADAPTEKLKQFLWRPRPANLLSKEEQKTIRRNLRDYSREFDEIDKEREEGANAAVVEQRRREYAEWFEFIDDIRAYVKEMREEEGRPDPEEELELQRTKSSAGGDEVVEEMIEELLEETEEFA